MLTEYIYEDKSNSCCRVSYKDCNKDGCHIKIIGTDAALLGLTYIINHATEESDCKQFYRMIAERYEYDGKSLIRNIAPDPGTIFAIETYNTNITCVPPPYTRGGWPGTDTETYHMDPSLEVIVKRADRLYMLRSTGTIFPDDAYSEIYLYSPITNKISELLGSMQNSMWFCAYGKTDGQPHWTNRAANLYPTKIVDICLKHAQNRHQHLPQAKELLPLYSMAFDFLYHRLGTSRFIGKMNWGLDIEAVEGRALHASAGNNVGRVEKFQVNDYTSILITPCGKKYENHVNDLQSWMDYMRDPDSPFSTEWKLSVKHEIVVHPGKKMNPEQAEANAKKGRTFCTPGSKYSCGEILVGQRMKLERGEWISIGHSWSRGGADKLAQSLGITSIEQGFEERLEEGDVTGMDHVVYGRDTDMYFSHGLVYDNPDHPDAFARQFITEYLIANLLCRQTQVMAHVWAFIRGEVPSGLQNTSHMDSFVMAFWFTVYILKRAFDPTTSLCDRTLILESFADWVISIVLYGDDHLFTAGDNPVLLRFFNIASWRDFLKKYYNVEIRDCKNHTTFLSIEKDGALVHVGSCYLKHYIVINPYKDQDGQPLFLPYRESKDIVTKAIVGREIKGTRTPLDVALSCIGHAYGTYASNRNAYDRLKALYESCLTEIPGQDQIEQMVLKASNDSKTVRTLNRLGIDISELYHGFPTWQALIDKNALDYASHNTKLWARSDLQQEEIY